MIQENEELFDNLIFLLLAPKYFFCVNYFKNCSMS